MKHLHTRVPVNTNTLRRDTILPDNNHDGNDKNNNKQAVI